MEVDGPRRNDTNRWVSTSMIVSGSVVLTFGLELVVLPHAEELRERAAQPKIGGGKLMHVRSGGMFRVALGPFQSQQVQQAFCQTSSFSWRRCHPNLGVIPLMVQQTVDAGDATCSLGFQALSRPWPKP